MGKSYLRTPGKFYIKDLLRHADVLEFPSVDVFKKSLHDGLIVPNTGRLVITVSTIKDIQEIQYIMVESELHILCRVVLEMSPDIFLEKIDQNLVDNSLNYETVVLGYIDRSVPDIVSKSEEVKEYIRSNPVFQKITINKDNYKTEFFKITEVYTTQELRLFDIEFDYRSLNEITFADIEHLEFSMDHFTKWMIATRESKAPLDIRFEKGLIKAYYIDAAMNVRLSSGSGRVLINLESNKDTFIEDIPFMEFNPFGVISDMKQDDLFFPLVPVNFNGLWIDLSINEDLESFANEVPYIACVVNSFLESA